MALMSGYAESGIANPKFVRFRASDGFVWSTAAVAFQVYASGSIANYGVAATETGVTGRYTATDPGGDTVGDYLLVKAVGASLAVSDVTAGLRWQDSAGAASLGAGTISRATFAADTGLQTVRSNTAQTGGASTITLDAGASAIDDLYTGQRIYLTGGTGAGQDRIITGYVGSTKIATAHTPWFTAPDITTTFAILPEGSDNVAVWGYSTNAAAVGGKPSVNTTSISTGAITSTALAASATAAIATAWGVRVLGNSRTADMYLQGLTNLVTFAADGLTWTLMSTDDTTPLATGTATRLSTSVGGLRGLDPA